VICLRNLNSKEKKRRGRSFHDKIAGIWIDHDATT